MSFMAKGFLSGVIIMSFMAKGFLSDVIIMSFKAKGFLSDVIIMSFMAKGFFSDVVIMSFTAKGFLSARMTSWDVQLELRLFVYAEVFVHALGVRASFVLSGVRAC